MSLLLGAGHTPRLENLLQVKNPRLKTAYQCKLLENNPFGIQITERQRNDWGLLPITCGQQVQNDPSEGEPGSPGDQVSYVITPLTRPETNSSHLKINGWKMSFRNLGRLAIFRGELLNFMSHECTKNNGGIQPYQHVFPFVKTSPLTILRPSFVGHRLLLQIPCKHSPHS